jgi:hypothetical protein
VATFALSFSSTMRCSELVPRISAVKITTAVAIARSAR